MQWANCKIQKAREDTVQRNLVGARSSEGLGALGRLGLEGLLLLVYPNWLSSGSITAWTAVERFYAEYFDFLFDNISTCYFVFVFFFPTFLTFIFLLCYIEYGLE